MIKTPTFEFGFPSYFRLTGLLVAEQHSAPLTLLV